MDKFDRMKEYYANNEAKMTISELQQVAYKQAADKGFHDHDDKISVGDRLALIHSEVSEALEASRTRGMGDWYHTENTGSTEPFSGAKPDGFRHELADIVIRVADAAETWGLDLEGAIREKLAYNKTRPYMHGNKRF